MAAIRRGFSPASRRTSNAVIAKPDAAISISPLLPTVLTKAVAISGPITPPMLPPAAMKPNSRLAWVREKISDMKDQNTEMIRMLKVLTQM